MAIDRHRPAKIPIQRPKLLEGLEQWRKESRNPARGEVFAGLDETTAKEEFQAMTVKPSAYFFPV